MSCDVSNDVMKYVFLKIAQYLSNGSSARLHEIDSSVAFSEAVD